MSSPRWPHGRGVGAGSLRRVECRAVVPGPLSGVCAGSAAGGRNRRSVQLLLCCQDSSGGGLDAGALRELTLTLRDRSRTRLLRVRQSYGNADLGPSEGTV